MIGQLLGRVRERLVGGERERQRGRDGDSKRQRITKIVAGPITVGYTSHIH